MIRLRLDLLGTFDAVARHLSITKAGQERFVTQSAVSHQIKSLEEDLGVDLFQRKHRSLQLTEDGRRLYETCAEMPQLLRTTVTRTRSPGSRQGLSLTTTPGWAALWPILRLPSFTQAHVALDLRPAVSVSFDFYDEAIAAAVAGQGVALGRSPLVDHLLASGALVAPFEQEVVSPRGHFLIVNPESRVRPEVRAFEAWLLDQARAIRPHDRRRN